MIKEYKGESFINFTTLSGDIDITGNYPKEKILCKKKLKIEIKKDLAGLKESLKSIIDTTKDSFGRLKDDLKGLEKNIVKEVNATLNSTKDKMEESTQNFKEKIFQKEEEKSQINDQEKLIDKVLDMVASGKITASEAEKLINSLREK